jgi:hypothetical protein
MSNNLESLLKKIKIDARVDNTFYVYYDQESGEIFKISPRKEEQTSYKILEIDGEFVRPMLTGEKKTSDFRVFYDIKSKTVFLKNISEHVPKHFDKIFYQIPKGTGSAELIVEQNFKNNKWKISIDNETLNFINTYKLSHYNKILLSVTKKDDPNILYRSLIIDAKSLIKRPVIIPFKFDFERLKETISIYTIKHFNSYIHKVTNDK